MDVKPEAKQNEEELTSTTKGQVFESKFVGDFVHGVECFHGLSISSLVGPRALSSPPLVPQCRSLQREKQNPWALSLRFQLVYSWMAP